MPDGRNGDGDGEGPDEEAGPDAPEKVEQDGDQDGDLSTSFLCKVIRAAPSCAFERPGAGTRLGGRDGQRFEVLGESGDGGMGFVVKAWDEQLRRVVALKFMLPERGLSDSELSLIRQEARAVARLDDENIVRIFDVDEWTLSSSRPGIPFIVMEFLEGELLATLVRRGKVGLRRALELMGALLSGLEHAHAQGVIHRDLKPGNVFILKDGKVKLLDFGLAHFTAAQGGPTPGMPRGGTPAYMAPEQWRGDHAQDARTDL
ncbi:MAG TPA: serine/threonine-protein kinase, partial [Myxococcaceae bacterium]|nr:serine/threonine-protein kinase [Myxococcaceae bacterium]